MTQSTMLGNWTIDEFWRVIGLSHTTGDSQLVVFSLEQQVTYIAYSEYGSGKPAYGRPPIVLSTKELLTSF